MFNIRVGVNAECLLVPAKCSTERCVGVTGKGNHTYVPAWAGHRLPNWVAQLCENTLKGADATPYAPAGNGTPIRRHTLEF
jgi:hypothetical protein